MSSNDLFFLEIVVMLRSKPSYSGSNEGKGCNARYSMSKKVGAPLPFRDEEAAKFHFHFHFDLHFHFLECSFGYNCMSLPPGDVASG